MKNIFHSLLSLFAIISFSSAIAQNPHFNSNRPPSVHDAGTTACATGTLHGLGNYAGQSISIQLFAEGTVATQCSNPSGNVAPGQNSTTTLSSELASVPVGKNGSASFNLCTTEPNVNHQTAGCPNSKWTGSATDVVFTRIWIVVGGTTIDLTAHLQ